MRKVLTGRLFAQKPEDKHKIYRLHAPEVDCISKGKARVRCEFSTNFVRTMLRLGRERDRLREMADQIGGSRRRRSIAVACLQIAAQLRTISDSSGTYYLVGTGPVSWAGFTRAIKAEAGLSCAIEVRDLARPDGPDIGRSYSMPGHM